MPHCHAACFLQRESYLCVSTINSAGRLTAFYVGYEMNFSSTGDTGLHKHVRNAARFHCCATKRTDQSTSVSGVVERGENGRGKI